MFSVRVRGADSWLDPESAAILGWKLGKRLWARCEGHEGRFITLTYDPKRYSSAQECFDQARGSNHVSRFMRKLAALLAVDLKGKWLCKMEFQQSGFVHWHIVLLDVGMIPLEQYKQIYSVWGRGSVNVKPLTQQNAMYLTKYVAKEASVPGWVYAYPPRSIKVVRPSQGFWDDEQAAIARARTAQRKADKASTPKAEVEFYQPIGEKIRTEKSLFRLADGKAFSIACPLHRVLRALRERCGEPRLEGRWRHYEDSPAVMARVIADCEGDDSASTVSALASRGERGAAESPGPLFLRGTGKRDGWWQVTWQGVKFLLSPADLVGKWSKWWAQHAPWYLKLSWEQEGRYERGMDMHGNWGWPPDAVVTIG